MGLTNTPLADRMRPRRLDEFIGQDHLTGAQGVIRLSIENNTLPSFILWGPPGVGKTTLAHIMATELDQPCHTLSAISAGVAEIRQVIKEATTKGKIILFIDEIHRFNKGQQDALLGAVEKGLITLVGATTENPSFEVNQALLSRCQVYTLNPLSQEELMAIVARALTTDSVMKEKMITIKEYHALFTIASGDARKVLNLIELMAGASTQEITITNDHVIQFAQQRVALYDKKGEQHYDLISAFIKSIRGSDPNAAVYYLARMIEGGEDVKFIARRMVISASEDIGNANPTALVIATSTFHAVLQVGYPEARIILSQCATYLACSPKSNASLKAIEKAIQMTRSHGDLPVPLSLRNAPTALMKSMNYGAHYQYAHHYSSNFVLMEYLPDALKNQVFYEPGHNEREREMRVHLKRLWGKKYNY